MFSQRKSGANDVKMLEAMIGRMYLVCIARGKYVYRCKMVLRPTQVRIVKVGIRIVKELGKCIVG